MSDLREMVEDRVARLLRERAGTMRQSLEEALGKLMSPVDLSLESGSWGSDSAAAQLRALREALESISRVRSQREVLSALLGAATTCYARTALFIVKGETLVGWAGRGFRDGGLQDADLASVSLPVTGDHILARALQSRSLILATSEGPGKPITAPLGGVAPRQSAAMPLLLRGKPVAVLYGDSGQSDEVVQELCFEIVARVGGLALEALAGDAPRRARPAGAPAQEPEGAAALQGGSSAPAPPWSATPPEEAEVNALLQDLDPFPRRETADSGQPFPDDEQRLRTDAQRFASLLVSELLLYNEDAVILGRKHRDLCTRLGTEIERSRRAYAARVPSDLTGAKGFLEDELVRVLAEGDRQLLGD